MSKAPPDQQEDTQPQDDGEITVGSVLRDFKRAFEAKKRFLQEARQDFEFALGKQWDAEDVAKLEKVGVRAITINKIAPHIQLLKGIESQNRSDFEAFPEGRDDELKAEIATRLMKNAVKNSGLPFKISEMFEDGNICGESTLEPWIHYPYKPKPDGTVDMNGELCWRKNHFDTVFGDPTIREYDHSDGSYFCKLTTDLTANQLKELFPDAEAMIDELSETGGKINLDAINLDRDQSGVPIQKRDYRDSGGQTDPWIPRHGFDLLDYYYKKYVDKFYVADFVANEVRLCKDEKEADNYLSKIKSDTTKQAKKMGMAPPKVLDAKKIKKIQPELWVAFLTGGDSGEFLGHGPAWSFPRWPGFPFFTYYCFKSDAPLKGEDRAYLTQGVTRRVKDLNRELNKRRTQELRHLNQSANSGWTGEEDAFVDESKWETFGSSPGVILKHKAGSQPPIKIMPTPLSQGHAQLASENTQDMRDAIGVNPETLAIEADQSSGRAIALRQKQGMVLVQGQFDNYARTRKQIGRFTLAVLPDLYDVEKAMRVLGQQFLQENFQSPVVDPRTGQPMVNMATGQPATQYDQNMATQAINAVLNDADLGNFDVAVGENISTETTSIANYMQLMDMASKGLPIPPDIIVEESTLSESQKKKIIAAFQTQASAAASQPPKPSAGGRKK